MNPMPIITLSDEERQYLVELSQSGSELISHRARLILAYAEGKPTISQLRMPGFRGVERASGNANIY